MNEKEKAIFDELVKQTDLPVKKVVWVDELPIIMGRDDQSTGASTKQKCWGTGSSKICCNYDSEGVWTCSNTTMWD